MSTGLIIISSVSLIIGAIGLLIAILALIEIKALKASTHKIEYVPMNQELDQDVTPSTEIDAYNKKIASERRDEELEILF